jgi:hypothetical protein
MHRDDRLGWNSECGGSGASSGPLDLFEPLQISHLDLFS